MSTLCMLSHIPCTKQQALWPLTYGCLLQLVGRRVTRTRPLVLESTGPGVLTCISVPQLCCSWTSEAADTRRSLFYNVYSGFCLEMPTLQPVAPRFGGNDPDPDAVQWYYTAAPCDTPSGMQIQLIFIIVSICLMLQMRL